MKVGIIIPIHNRYNYLKDTLWSLERIDLPSQTEICLWDDASTDPKVKVLIDDFEHDNALTSKMNNENNLGIRDTLLRAYGYMWHLGCDLVINFDSDAIIKPNAIDELVEYYIPGTLLTGFHSTTRNANGTERHHIISEQQYTYFKKSVGGINFCVDKQAYELYMKPALNNIGNFDHNACINAGGAYCIKESVVQHIGFESSLNHTEQPDVADDFYYYDLPDVTLIGIDNQVERLVKAKNKCTEFIRFGEVVLLHPPIYSKESYSEFCIKQLYKHVKTSHMLIFQHDGYVNNWKAWNDDWLQYDYIGAPWHYDDGMAVGNGGFSLRSQRLMEILALDPKIQFTHPEDHHICRTYRPYLEATYGIKFAPAEVAEQFSFEGYLQPHKQLGNQFGVHGKRGVPTKRVNNKYIMGQFFGLGDILFLVPMARALMAEGNEVLWPIADYYIDIAKHFPDISFVKQSYLKLPYDARYRINTPYGDWLPYRYAAEILGVGFPQMMRAKYDMYGHDYRMWRSLYYKRFPEREKELAEVVGASGKYILANFHFGQPKDHLTKYIEIDTNLPIIEMQTIEGFTLIDWLGVIEHAAEVHVVNSSIMYLLDLMDLKMPIHVYKRELFGEKGFEFTQHLWESNKFIYHE